MRSLLRPALLLVVLNAFAVAPPASAQTESEATYWAFQRLRRPTPPSVKQAEKFRTNIDRFILAKLEEKGLGLSPAADRTALLRRAFFDLTGLPPAPVDVTDFVADQRPDAFERLIDRLLASSHFGERWGRHWLDAAGYVDVFGSDNDAAIINPLENKWFYRDYVVRSFNQDKPFDRFVTEQIAGDELVDWRSAESFTPQIKELLVATGYLLCSADDTNAPELNTPDTHHAVLQRTAEIVSNHLLGLTVHCAKCHDHKFDPISQREYYQLEAYFAPAFNLKKWVQPKDRPLADISPTEKARFEKQNAALQAEIDRLKGQSAEKRRPYELRLFDTKLAAVPEPIRGDTKAAVQTPADNRTEIQKYLAGKFEGLLKVKPEEVAATLNVADKAALADIDTKIATLAGQRRSWSIIQAVYDVGPPSPTHLLRRGNHETPGAEVQPGFLQVLFDPKQRPAPANPIGKSSGRRLALAKWLTDTDSPASGLVARVYINRVWQHLFGKGLVATSDNFGQSGTPPTHPELLDWLASEFIHQNWQLKPFLRQLMTSAVYRQASTQHAARSTHHFDHSGLSTQHAALRSLSTQHSSVDPDNHLLWSMRLRRLESESVRDAILAVSGGLNRSLGGPPLPLDVRADGSVAIKEQGLPSPTSKNRRSLYVLARRNYHLSMLNTFDQPAVTASCAYRTPSAVVAQSLTMLNDVFVQDQANHFAERVVQAAGEAGGEKTVEYAFLTAFARPPKAAEKRWCVTFLGEQRDRLAKNSTGDCARQALTQLCHMLLNTNEFLYVP